MARDIFRELQDRNLETMVLGNLSFLHSELGDLETAEREAKTALAIQRETGGVQFRVSSELSLAQIYLRLGRNAEARRYTDMTLATAREVGLPLVYLPLFYGILKVRSGDRPTGLAWIGFTRAHELQFKKEVAKDIQRMWDEIRGDLSDEEADAAMRRGESLTAEEILAQAAQERT
jgi:tetratricopeptide (TPR) repeat protein